MTVAMLLGIALLVAGLLVAIGILLRVQRRQHEQLRSLLLRIERIESSDTEPPDGAEAAEPTAPDPHSAPALSADVLAGRSSLVRRVIEGGAAGTDELAVQAIARVHRGLEEPMTPGRLADELYLSLRSLERGLALSLDCTPRQLILAMKMREARRLLESGSLQVAEVAYRLAFASPAHFSRRFKSFYHVAPSKVIPR